MSRSLLPPNRACGSPAHGSPVGGITLTRIGDASCGSVARKATHTTQGKHYVIASRDPTSGAANTRNIQTGGLAQPIGLKPLPHA